MRFEFIVFVGGKAGAPWTIISDVLRGGKETFEEGGISWMFGDSERFEGRF